MLEGRHYQNAYVTRNLAKTVDEFAARASARSVATYEATTEVLTADGRRSQTLKLGFVWLGDLQYEFIEPVVEAVPVYSSWLSGGDGPRFHHSCARVDDWDDFRRRVDDQPCPVVFEGASGDELKFLYLDARELLGHYLEYTWMTPGRWAQLGGR
jgi:Glyoxalase/Bleomycin resistance protein/Dioxygenase superfamily